MFMVYSITEVVLIWRTEFIAVYTYGNNLYLGELEDFFDILDYFFKPLNLQKNILQKLHTLKQRGKTIDEYMSEFRVYTSQPGLSNIL